MAAMKDLLDRYGLAEDELVAAVDTAMAAVPVPVSAGLTDQQRQTLTAGGLRFGPAADEAGHHARAAALAEQVALLAGPDTAEVADALGVGPSRVRHMVAAGDLYALKVGRSLRFPRFQFGPDGRPVANLRAVLAAVPRDWPAAQLAAFMTTPQAELAWATTAAEPGREVQEPGREVQEPGREASKPVSPADWLAASGDPAAVTPLMAPDWA